MSPWYMLMAECGQPQAHPYFILVNWRTVTNTMIYKWACRPDAGLKEALDMGQNPLALNCEHCSLDMCNDPAGNVIHTYYNPLNSRFTGCSNRML